MSDVIGDVVAGALEDLAAAGVDATADPDVIGPMIAGAAGAAALILPPEVHGRALGGGMDLRLEVMLLGAPPGGLAQYRAVWGRLPAAMDALHCSEASRTTYEVGGITYPGYLLPTVTGTTT